VLPDTEALFKYPRYQGDSRELFNATLDSTPIFQRYFTNHNIKGDASEPYFEGKDSHMIQETKEAYDALLEAGFLDTHYDADDDGLRLPEIILRAQWPNLTPKILPLQPILFKHRCRPIIGRIVLYPLIPCGAVLS
jgi:hypothetical protein